jgi:hypothetical protein
MKLTSHHEDGAVKEFCCGKPDDLNEFELHFKVWDLIPYTGDSVIGWGLIGHYLCHGDLVLGHKLIGLLHSKFSLVNVAGLGERKQFGNTGNDG